jgi:hypothetical protein
MLSPGSSGTGVTPYLPAGFWVSLSFPTSPHPSNDVGMRQGFWFHSYEKEDLKPTSGKNAQTDKGNERKQQS